MTWGRELCKNEFSVILTKFPQLNPPNKRILSNFTPFQLNKRKEIRAYCDLTCVISRKYNISIPQSNHKPERPTRKILSRS